ncbi:hypothetical protein MRY82_06685 [bacterium]|nr:hypothetical protein [bacterium]
MAFFLKHKVLLFFYTILAAFLYYIGQSSFLFNFDYEFFFILNVFLSFHILVLHLRKPGQANVKHILLSFAIAIAVCFTVNLINHSICSFQDSLYWFTVQSLSALLANLALFKVCQYLFPNQTLRRCLTHILFIILLSLPVVYDLIFSPQLSFFHIVFGYYHGPIYDAYIPKLASFLLFRTWTSIIALYVICFFSYQKLRLFNPKFKTALMLILVGLLIIPLTLRHSLGWVQSYTSIQKTLNQHLGLGPVHLYYSPTSYTPQQAKVLLKSLHFEYMFLANTLGLKKEVLSSVNVYIYPDQYTKKKLIGSGLTLIGNAMQNSMHALPISPDNSILRHELAHIILRPYGFYGLSTSPALIEGFATSLEYERHGLSVHEWSKVIAEKKLVPSLQTLFSPSGFWSRNSYVSYLYTGSFMRWLLQNFPKDKVLASYAGGNFKKHLKQSLLDLEQQWLKFIASIDISKQAQEKALFFLQQKPITQKKCPHQVACIQKQQKSCADLNCKTTYQKTIILYSKNGAIRPQLKLLRYYLTQGKLALAKPLIKKLNYETLNRQQRYYLDLMHTDYYLLNGNKLASQALLLELQEQLTEDIENNLNLFIIHQHLLFRLDNLSSSALPAWLKSYYQKKSVPDLAWEDLKANPMFYLVLMFQYQDFSAYPEYRQQIKSIQAQQQLFLLRLQAQASSSLFNWDEAIAAYTQLLNHHSYTNGERFYYQQQLNRIKSLR